MTNIEYEKILNKSQLEAVTAPDGPLLVIAGAGSGKTRTLVYRVAWLVERGVEPEKILLLTFTRKAAREMLERAAAISDDRCRMVSGGTFHSLAREVLRKNTRKLGFSPSFIIMDRSDMEEAVRSLVSQLNTEKNPVRFPKASTVTNILSKAANLERPVSAVMDEEYPHFLPLLSQIEHLHGAYREYKARNNLMDFDDLLLFLRTLLKEHRDVCLKLSRKYKYIMVDEYQDTNTIQAGIIYYLGSFHRNVMAVGDDSQSIYAFRGADFKNMFNFPDLFPETRVIRLEENYRSTQPILNMTNALMAQASQKYTKCLYTRRKGDELPLSVDTGTERNQALYVCRTIERLMDEGRELNDIAVLFRAGYHSFELELELVRRNIPFAKYGGFKFMESAHIKDVLIHLRVIINKGDILSWGRLLRLLKNIGQEKSQAIIEWIRAGNIPLSRLYEWPKANKEKEGLARLAGLMGKLSKPDLSPGRAVELAVQYYESFLKEKFDDFPRRQQELEQLVFMASRYKTVKHFLDDISLEPPTSSADVRPADREDCLTLSTIHSAKGLEWGVVFIIWLLDGRFPPGRSLIKTEKLEEELRLLYVAATRAKDKVIMAYPGEEIVGGFPGAIRGQFKGRASSFIRALPQEVINHHSYVLNGVSPDGPGFSYSAAGMEKVAGNLSELRPGDRVVHPAFGKGVISKFLGTEKVEVFFQDRGTKLLHLGYTTLERI